jgi:hypothetical protein
VNNYVTNYTIGYSLLLKISGTKPLQYDIKTLSAITDYFLEEIGKGSYATVFKGKERSKDVAVKRYNESDKNQWEAEIEILQKIQGFHVVQLHGFAKKPPDYYLVLEFLHTSLDKTIEGT